MLFRSPGSIAAHKTTPREWSILRYHTCSIFGCHYEVLLEKEKEEERERGHCPFLLPAMPSHCGSSAVALRLHAGRMIPHCGLYCALPGAHIKKPGKWTYFTCRAIVVQWGWARKTDLKRHEQAHRNRILQNLVQFLGELFKGIDLPCLFGKASHNFSRIY